MTVPQLGSTRKSYKIRTGEVASWLVSTAEAAGFPPSGPPNKVDSTVSRSSKQENKIKTTDEYIALANHIANTGDHQTPVPKLRYILRQIDSIIKLRTRYSQQLRLWQDTTDIASDRRHDYFIETLRRVRDTLSPCLARVQPPTAAGGSEGEAVTRLQSQFDLLPLFGGSSASSSSSSRSSSPHSMHQDDAEVSEGESGIELTHQFEVTDWEEEVQLYLQMLIEDYLALICFGKDLWAKAKEGLIHRGTAAQATLLLVGAFLEALSECEEEIAKLNPQADVYRLIYDAISSSTLGEFHQTAKQLTDLRGTALPILRRNQWPSDLISQHQPSAPPSSVTDNSAELFCTYALAALLARQVDKKAGKPKMRPQEGQQPDIFIYDSPFCIRDELMLAMYDFIVSPPENQPSIRIISVFALYLTVDQVVDDTILTARSIFEREVSGLHEDLKTQLKTYKAGVFKSPDMIRIVEEHMADISLISNDPMYELYTGRFGKKPGYRQYGLMARSPVMGALLASYCCQTIHRDQKRVTAKLLQPLHIGLARIYTYAKEAGLIETPWLDMELLLFLSSPEAYLANANAAQPPGRQSPFQEVLLMAGIPSNGLRRPENVSMSSLGRGTFTFPNLDPPNTYFASHRTLQMHTVSAGHGWTNVDALMCIHKSKWSLRNVTPPDGPQGYQVWPPFSPTRSNPNGGRRFDQPGPGDRVICLPAGFPPITALHIAIQEQELAATQVPWKALSIVTNLVWASVRPQKKLVGSLEHPFLGLVEFLRQDEVTIQRMGVDEAREELHIHRMALKLQELMAEGKIAVVKGDWRSRLEQNVYVQVGDVPGEMVWCIARSVF